MAADLDEFLFAHYSEDYKTERERTDGLRDRVSFVVGFLTILGGVLGYSLSHFPHSWHGGRTLFFYVPFGLAASGFCASAFTVLWVIGGSFRYESIPSNPELQEYCDQLEKWALANCVTVEVLPTLKTSLLAAYRDASHHNFLVNRSRIDRLLLATRVVVIAFLCAGAMLPAYIYELSVKEKEPTLVRLLPSVPANPDKPKHMPESTPSASAAPEHSKSPAPAPTASPVEAKPVVVAKPKFPANQRLSEGAVKMETFTVDGKATSNDSGI